MYIDDFKGTQGDRFPTEFLDCLPEKCPVCGCRLRMTEVLTRMECTNPRCSAKVAKRVALLAHMLDINDFTDEEAKAFIEMFRVQNPLMLFAYTTGDGILGTDISLARSAVVAEAIEGHRDVSLSDYVRYACIPYVRDSVDLIFDGTSSLDEVYVNLESGGVDYIRRCLTGSDGSDADEISMRALKIYEALETYKYDLYEALPYVRIGGVG